MNLLHPQASPDPTLLGRKAAALLTFVDLNVPPWFVIPVQAFDDQGYLGGDTREAIARACTDLEATHFAVRSSAADEDGHEHSFAGQLDSFLEIPTNEVADYAEKVWASGYGERGLAYRREHGLGDVVPPAVLVQVMLRPRAAGVAFAVDPINGRMDHCLINAVPGLGEALVDGSSAADTWSVDRDGTISDQHIAAGKQRRFWNGSSIDTSSSDAASLSDDEVRQVAELARRCTADHGTPQDIEWAITEQGLFLLQSRPITGLGRIPDPGGVVRLWDNSNIAESYGGITTPLTYTFARDIYAAVYRQFCRIMGVSESVISKREGTFRGLLGLVRGRMYYNLLEWYRLLACFPGYQMNRGFMEQMMGVKDGLPPELHDEIRTPSFGAKLMDGLRFTRSLAGLLRAHLGTRNRVRAFQVRLDQALAAPAQPWHLMTSDELVAEYRRLEEALLLKWDAPLVNDFFAMIFFGLLKKTCASWCADADGTLQNALLGGEGGVISAEPAKRITALAEVCRGNDKLITCLITGDRPYIEAALQQHPLLTKGIANYQEQFADRCLEELKLESPTLRDDPMPLYRAIGHMATRPQRSSPTDPAVAQREQAEARVSERLGWRPLRRLLFSWILRTARDRVRDRENLRFERTRLFGRVRRIYTELGSRFTAAGILDRVDDIFYCEKDEILGFVEGNCSCPDLRALAAARRGAFEAYQHLPPPADRFPTHGWVYAGQNVDPQPCPGEQSDGDARQGLGCCPGVIEGVVRVITDPRGAEVPQGSILVAERTDPGWIMLFPAAAGLVVERGSLLSHSAIVSRELGLPCVVGVGGATQWLQDGERVRIDGSAGTVTRVTP